MSPLPSASGIRFIVAFSDPEHNEFPMKAGKPNISGGIYAACRFTYLGQTQREYHNIHADGVLHHRWGPQRLMERINLHCPAGGTRFTLAQARNRKELVRIATRRKDRWFKDMGKLYKDLKNLGKIQMQYQTRSKGTCRECKEPDTILHGFGLCHNCYHKTYRARQQAATPVPSWEVKQEEKKKQEELNSIRNTFSKVIASLDKLPIHAIISNTV